MTKKRIRKRIKHSEGETHVSRLLRALREAGLFQQMSIAYDTHLKACRRVGSEPASLEAFARDFLTSPQGSLTPIPLDKSKPEPFRHYQQYLPPREP